MKCCCLFAAQCIAVKGLPRLDVNALCPALCAVGIAGGRGTGVDFFC